MFLLVDIEATCWDDKKEKWKQSHAEIIELSAIMLNEKFNISHVFSEFIKPIREPILSDFCINLTGINQQDVNSANEFTTVMKDFDKWLILNRDKYCHSMIVWGNYDEYLLRKNLNMYKYKKGEICKYAFGNRVKNIQSKFEEIMYLPNSTCSLSKALSIIGEPFLGVKHSGINDVKNMLKVFAFINRIDKSKYIEKNKMFVDYINEIRERNKKEIEKRELQKLKRKEEKEMI